MTFICNSIHGHDTNVTSKIKQANEAMNAASTILAMFLDERLLLRVLMANNTPALGGLHVDEVLNLISQEIRDNEIESARKSKSMVPDDMKFRILSKIYQKQFTLIKMTARAQVYLYLDGVSLLSDTSDLDTVSHYSDTSGLDIVSHYSESSDLDTVSHYSDTSDLDIMSHYSDSSDLDIESHYSDTLDLDIVSHYSDTSDSRIELNTNINSYLQLIISDFWTLLMMEPYISLVRNRWSVNELRQIYFLIIRNDFDSIKTAKTTEHWLSFFNDALTFHYIYYDDINEVRQRIKPSTIPSTIYVIGHGTKESVGGKSGKLVNRVNLLHCINDCFHPLDTKKYRDRRNSKRRATVVLTECLAHKYCSENSAKGKGKLFRNIRIVTLTSDTMEKTFFSVRNENIPLLYYILKSEMNRLLG